jgi:hypothetical protein
MNASLLFPLFIVLAIVAIVATGLRMNTSATRTRQRREAFIKHYVFPDVLRRKIAQKHPQLSAPQIDLVFGALRQYFYACLAAKVTTRGGSVGMPSRVVDDLWHEFMLMSREYASLCQKAFGGFLHHAPDTEMKVPMQAAVSNTLNALKPRGGIAPGVETLAGIPLLFATDKALAISNGFYHDADSIAAIEARRHTAQTGGGCSGGVSVSSSCGASVGSGSADGGTGDGGGSDGGGCGGGCGSE